MTEATETTKTTETTETTKEVYARIERFVKKLKVLTGTSIAILVVTAFLSFTYGTMATLMGITVCGVIIYYVFGMLENAEKTASEKTKGN